MCDITHSCVWHDSFIWVTWLFLLCHTNHSYVWHNLFICVTRLINMYDMTHLYPWPDSLTCMTWHVDVCDITHSHSCVWHDSMICVTWLIDMSNLTHWCVWHHSFIQRILNRLRVYAWHNSSICLIHRVTRHGHTYKRVIVQKKKSLHTAMKEPCHTYRRATPHNRVPSNHTHLSHPWLRA